METLFFAVVAILVLGRLYQVLGQNHDAPTRLNDNFVNDQIAPNGGAFGINNGENKNINISNSIEVSFTNSEEFLKAQWGELAPQIIELKKREPSFDPMKFKETSALAYDAIISAFGKNDKNTLKDLVSPNVFDAFNISMEERATQGRGEIDVVKLSEAKLISIEINDQIAQIDVEFKATLSAIGEVQRTTDEIWTFERKIGARSPVWILVAVEQK